MSLLVDNVQIEANILTRSFMDAYKLPYKETRLPQVMSCDFGTTCFMDTNKSEVSYLVDDI